MKDLIFSLSYNLLTRFVLLIISILSVKLLTVAEYGELSYILVITGTLAIISLFGGGTAVNRSFSLERKSNSFKLSNQIFFFNIIISLLITVILFFLSWFFISDLQAIIFIFMIFSLMSVNSIVEGAMYGLGKYRSLAINSSIVLFLSIILGYFLISKFKVLGALIAIFLYRLILLFLNFVSILKLKVLGKVSFLSLINNKGVISSFKDISLPTFFGAILVAPVMLILMHFLKNTPNGLNEMAYFSWNNQIYTLAVFIPSVLTGFLISKMSSENRDVKNKLIKYIKYNFIFGFILSVILFLVKPFILGWAGSSYVENGNVSYNIMLLAIVCYCLNSVFGSYWISVNKAKFGFLINFFWACIVIITSYFLINKLLSNEAIFVSLTIGYLLIFLVQWAVLLTQRIENCE